MSKQVVIFIAPPGGGKGTQADLIAKTFKFYHLETSKILEKRLVNSTSNAPEIAEAKRQFKAGELVTPALVKKLVIQEIRKLHKNGKSIVFSGSFRTLEEAEEEIPIIEELYGKANIKVFNITLSEAESIKRNSHRRICQKNRHTIPDIPQYRNLDVCPEDGSPVITRVIDKPEIIRERYQVYKAETEPVLDYFKQKGYNVTTINGEQPIIRVFEDIMKHFETWSVEHES